MRPTLLILISFITLTVLPAGLLLLLDPTGISLGLPMELLSNTPLADYFLSGLMMAFIVGGASLTSLFLLLSQKSWSYRVSLICGIVLSLWVAAELIIVPYYHWLEGLYLTVGLLVILLSYQLMGKAAF